MKVLGPKELLDDVINKDLCIGCGACIHLCPYFKSYKGKTAMLFPCTLEKGRCFAHCPKVEIELDELSQEYFDRPYEGKPLGHYRSIHISKSGPKAGNGAFQAGGTVSALMSFALSKGYVNAAVLTDQEGLLPVPKIVTEAEDALRCSSSKYSAAPTLSALNQAMEEDYEKIAVVATPCQVLSIAQMRMNPLEKENFTDSVALVVGLFCTWALDFRSFTPFISKQVDINKIKKIDIPPPPAEIMEVYTEDEKIEIPLEEIRKLVPGSCNYCIDMTSEFSDISVGVLEGRPDMNTLIIRTEQGQKIIDEAVREEYLILDDMPKENLEHLMWAAGNKKKKALTRVKDENMVNTEEEKISYLRIDPKTVEYITQ
jgi:coenzyme F420 hydrogenase subunit beta